MWQLQIYISECMFFFPLNNKDEMPLMCFFSFFQNQTVKLVTFPLVGFGVS